MKIVIFCHSLISDWNHGNAHFVRGVVAELSARGVDVIVYEPKGSWDLGKLQREYGQEVLEGFRKAYPDLTTRTYDSANIDVNKALAGADAVIVQDGGSGDVARRIGEHHLHKGHYVLLYYDSQHRSVIDPESMAAFDLHNFDGLLAVGNAARDAYLREQPHDQAWTWHEAADTRLFRPIFSAKEGDLVWIGNWDSDERTAELREFLIEPVKQLGIRAKVFGALYPQQTIRELEKAGIEYGGWLPNFKVPAVYAKFRVTVHVPRRTSLRTLPGIPSIRVFEALACGIPLISAPWSNSERLFTRADYLSARNREEMIAQISWVLHNEAAAREIASHGRRTVLEAHTCSHRADELLQIIDIAQRDAVRKASA